MCGKPLLVYHCRFNEEHCERPEHGAYFLQFRDREELLYPE